MKKLLIAVFMLFVSTGISMADSNLQDDFNTLNRDYWLVYTHGGNSGPYSPAYRLATINNGVLDLTVNDTDMGPELISKGIPITPNSVVTASWRLKAHYANEYFAGLTGFYLVDYSGFYDPDKGESIRPFEYWDESAQRNIYKSAARVYYRNYFYGNYQPPYKGNNFGFCACGGDCFVTTPLWDAFVEFKVVLDFKNGKARYWQDGQLVGETTLDCSDLDLEKFKYLKILFSPYGWWTGHSIQIDWFRLSIEDGNTSTNMGPCESCVPRFNFTTNTLEIPALPIGADWWSLNLALQSVVPAVTFRLESYDRSACSQAILQQCINCLPTFDASSYVLHIPYISLGQADYRLDLSILTVIPTVELKLDAYDQSTCSPSGSSGTGGNGGGTACNDCSCDSYANSHPDECGRTGNLNFRITWHDENDVDLKVRYEGNDGTSEEIYYSNTTGSITGGQLDVDANRNCQNTTNNPVENIVFDNPKPGTYTVKVCGYRNCSNAPSSSRVIVQILRDGRVVDQKSVTISQWNSCVTAFTYEVMGSTSTNPGTGVTGASSGLKHGTLSTQGARAVSFVRNEFSSNLSDYDLALEPWCIDGVGLCGNWVSVGNVPLSADIAVPSSGYLSDEAGYENCEEIDITKTYVNKNRDGSYTAFKITNHQKIGNCDHSITLDYIMLVR